MRFISTRSNKGCFFEDKSSISIYVIEKILMLWDKSRFGRLSKLVIMNTGEWNDVTQKGGIMGANRCGNMSRGAAKHDLRSVECNFLSFQPNDARSIEWCVVRTIEDEEFGGCNLLLSKNSIDTKTLLKVYAERHCTTDRVVAKPSHKCAAAHLSSFF